MNPWHNYEFFKIFEPDWRKFVEKLTWEIVDGVSRDPNLVVPSEDTMTLNKIYNRGDKYGQMCMIDEEILMVAYEVLSEK